METKLTFKWMDEHGVKIGGYILAYDEHMKIKRYKIESTEIDHFVVKEVGKLIGQD